MPALRPGSLLRGVNASRVFLSQTAARQPSIQPQTILQRGGYGARALSTSKSMSAEHAAEDAVDHAHEDHYDPPTGWLWGIKPGEKPEKEGWETIFYVGFFGSFLVGVVGYAFKPDTS